MCIRLILLLILPVLGFGCAHSVGKVRQSQDVLLSFPSRLKPGKQIVAFEITVTNGKIAALNKAPVDWMVHMIAGWWDSTITGTPGHGASAFQDTAPLQRFLTLQKDTPEFDITGSLVVTTDFTSTRTNVFRKSDFILEEIPHAPPRTAAGGRGCNRRVSSTLRSTATEDGWPRSLSLGR